MPKQWHISQLSLSAFKSFAEHTSFDVPSHQLVGITGPNGSGKSNLLEALCFAAGCPASDLRSSLLKDCQSSDESTQVRSSSSSNSKQSRTASSSSAGKREHSLCWFAPAAIPSSAGCSWWSAMVYSSTRSPPASRQMAAAATSWTASCAPAAKSRYGQLQHPDGHAVLQGCELPAGPTQLCSSHERTQAGMLAADALRVRCMCIPAAAGWLAVHKVPCA